MGREWFPARGTDLVLFAIMEKALLLLRQTFSKIKMRPFTSNLKETEKTWFQHAQRSWENVKTSNFYMEYSRLLRNH